jgi:hypothetical protein
MDAEVLEQGLARAMGLHARIPGSPPPRPEALLALPGVMRQRSADPADERATATHRACMNSESSSSASLVPSLNSAGHNPFKSA